MRPVALLVGVLAAALLGSPGAVLGADDAQSELAQVKLALAQLQRPAGRDVYLAACAPCHGRRGDGLGPAAGRFDQRPTAFSNGVYKLRSTAAKVVLPGDLERTIRDGMPGTEMVPFRGLLTDATIREVATYVRGLAATPEDPALAAQAQPAQVPAERPFARSDESVAKGKEVYTNRCLECHGDFGEGSTKEKDDWGFPVRMQDFRSGVYKSGPSDGDLVRSTLTGLAGTSMGGYSGDLSPDEIWNVVDYIRSLSAASGGFVGRLWNYFLAERPSRFNYGTP